MFEKSGSNADSSSPRGLSPADSVTSGERPTRKIRTSFVAVEPSGRVDVGDGGDKADGAGTVNGTDGSNQNVDGVWSVPVNRKGEEVAVENKERIHTKEGSGILQNGDGGKTKTSVVDGEKAKSMATDANQPRNNPKFKAELDQIVARSAINGTGEQQKPEDQAVSRTDTQVQPQPTINKTKDESKSPMNKSKDILAKSPRANGNKPNDGKNAVDIANGANHDNGESEKFKKSPLSTPRRSKAAGSMNNNDAILSPRNVALPKSPNSSKSITRTAQGMQGSPTKTKVASIANAKPRVSSSGAAAKLPGSSIEKSSVKSPSTATAGTSTARKGAPSMRKSSVTMANSQKLANSKEKRASLPPDNESTAKKPSLKASPRANVGSSKIMTEKMSDSPNDPASQPLKSPRRSGPLSAHLVAPTASSTAKHSLQSSQPSQSQSHSFARSTSAINRKSPTMTRDRNAGTAKSTATAVKPSAATSLSSTRSAPNTKKATSTSTDSKRQHSRASLPSTLSKGATNKSTSSKAPASSSTIAATTTRGAESSHSSNVRSPGKSFLDRMTRPTASFASKTHEKVDVKSPPPRRSASVRTRPKPALGETGKNVGNKGTAVEGSGTGPMSRTRALQDALIGSKGRKQGAGASTGNTAGTAGSRKVTPGLTKKEAGKEKEGAGKGHANDEVKPMNEKSTEQVSSVPKQEEKIEVASAKEKTTTPNEDTEVDDKNQSSLSEMNVETNETKEEKPDEIPQAESPPEANPEQGIIEAKVGGRTEEESHVNGENVAEGNVLENKNKGSEGEKNEDDNIDDSRNATKNNDKPATEQDNVQDTTISSDGISDPFVMETPKFERTVIR